MSLQRRDVVRSISCTTSHWIYAQRLMEGTKQKITTKTLAKKELTCMAKDRDFSDCLGF
jgi:hypothetical protein